MHTWKTAIIVKEALLTVESTLICRAEYIFYSIIGICTVGLAL